LSVAYQYTSSIHSSSIILFSSGEITIFDISFVSSQGAGTLTWKAGTIIVGLYCFGKII
jgi:hypothetical protein